MKQATSNLMDLTLDDEWLEQAVRLEEEAGCSVSAGFDWGADGADYLRAMEPPNTADAQPPNPMVN